MTPHAHDFDIVGRLAAEIAVMLMVYAKAFVVSTSLTFAACFQDCERAYSFPVRCLQVKVVRHVLVLTRSNLDCSVESI